MVIKKQKFKFEDFWAETIQKIRFQNKEFLFANVRKKHGYDDINMEGEPQWVGLTEKPIYKKVLDVNPDSDTEGQRITQTNKYTNSQGEVEEVPILDRTTFEFTHEATKINIENFKKLYGSTIQGTTQLIWNMQSKNYNCEYPNDFWEVELKTVEDKLTQKRTIQ